jgi:hypothetical protein
MAVVLIEGFDHYPDGSTTQAGGMGARWTASTTSSWGYPAGRIAGRCARRSGSGQITFDRPLPSELTSLTVGFAVLTDTAAPNSTQELVSLRSSGGAQLVIGGTSGGLLQVGRGSFSNIFGTEAAGDPWQAEAWYFLEIEAVIHGSTGEVRVYKNGVEVINVSGVNTKGQAQYGVSTLRLRMPGTGSGWGASSFDDVYVADAATRLGDSRVITLVPDGDTGDKDWTPSSGENNYAMVDQEQVDGDSSYIASSTPGDLDIYTLGNLGVTPETIHAVQLMMCARKDDAATREVRLKLKSGSTVENGATQVMGTSYQYFHEIYDDDPDAAGPWTAAAVGAMQIGIETVT